MSALTQVVARVAEVLREHGSDLVLGCTIVLGCFALGALLTRAPARRHRLAGTALLASAAYVVFALVPMPRLSLSTAPPAHATSEPSTATAGSTSQPTASADLTPPLPATSAPPARPRLLRSLPLVEAAAPSEPARGADLAWWLAAAGLTGAAVFVLQLLLGWLRLRAVLRDSRPASRRLRELVPLPRRTRVRISRRAGSPFCCGLLRPTIVLPPQLARGGDAARFVLLHERAHLRSGDPALRTLAAWLRPLLFWHPLYWWLLRELRFTGELLADDAAAEGAVAAYARCMMALADRSTPSPTGPLVATVFRRRSELFRRLEMMLTRNEALSRSSRTPRWLRALTATTLVALCAGTFGVERAVAQNPARDEMAAEIAALRATIRSLEGELARLQRYADGAPQPASTPPTDAPSSPPLLRDLPVVRAVLDREAAAKSATPNDAAQPAVIPAPTPRATGPRSSLTELVDLVSRCIALDGEFELQELAVDAAKDDVQKYKDPTEAKRRYQIERVKLRTLERQRDALRGMLKQQLENARQQHEQAQKLHARGLVNQQEVHDAASRLKLLERGLR